MSRKAYKLFRIKDGKLYPLYITANDETVIGKWIPAKCGPMIDATHVKANGCGGKLALRPGWHLAEIPNAPWIGKRIKDSDGNDVLLRRSDTVWCECEYSDDINYQEYVNELGRNKNGIIIPKNAMMRDIPIGGFYMYKTNSQGDTWIIAGAIKVNRILSNEEVETICKSAGVVPQKVVA